MKVGNLKKEIKSEMVEGLKAEIKNI